MNYKKPLLVAAVATSLGMAGLTGSNLVSAATNTGGTDDSLVSKIAKKFNLKDSDVQAVFDADHSAKEADHQAQVEKDLTQAVTDGKLTADQKDKLIAKQKELQASREADHSAMQNKTPAEHKAAMDAKRTELEKWATDNGIPTEFLRYVMGGGHGGGHGPGGPMGH